MSCKIVRPQKLMWRNIMRSTKSQISFGFTLQYRYIYGWFEEAVGYETFVHEETRLISMLALN